MNLTPAHLEELIDLLSEAQVEIMNLDCPENIVRIRLCQERWRLERMAEEEAKEAATI